MKEETLLDLEKLAIKMHDELGKYVINYEQVDIWMEELKNIINKLKKEICHFQ